MSSVTVIPVSDLDALLLSRQHPFVVELKVSQIKHI